MTNEEVLKSIEEKYETFSWIARVNNFETISNGVTIQVIKKPSGILICFSEPFNYRKIYTFPCDCDIYNKIGNYWLKTKNAKRNSMVSRALN